MPNTHDNLAVKRRRKAARRSRWVAELAARRSEQGQLAANVGRFVGDADRSVIRLYDQGGDVAMRTTEARTETR